MTLADWLNETRERFETKPVPRATAESVDALRMGAQHRLGNWMGDPIWEREWDVLVVLDACRTDHWREVAPEYGLPRGRAVTSNASCSIDWIERNFVDRPEAERAGYVTGNPFASHDAEEARSADLDDEDLGYFAPLHQREWQAIDGGPVETIPPEPLTDHAISTWRRRDELGIDRLVIHYMQPHQPFRSRPDWVGVGKNLKNLVDDRDMAGACAWQRARKGEIDTDELWAACEDNLRWALDDITERLLHNVEGTVAFTADHGNAMGEWGEWAHPPGAISPAVRRVPWATVESADMRTEEPGFEDANPGVGGGETGVQDRLEALGYK